MKKILVALAFVAATGSIHAQTAPSPNEAKAAYLLAEESYGKGDYKAALDFIQQVKASLGAANCKILYLEIMITKELYTKDPATVAEKVLPLIEQFEKSPDYADFNEEKSLEITKLKLGLRSALKSWNEKNAVSHAAEKKFADEFNRFGPFGITRDQLAQQKPAWNLPKWKEASKNTIFDRDAVSFTFGNPGEAFPFGALDKDIDFNNRVIVVLFTEGKVSGYRSVLVYADKRINKESVASGKALADANNTVIAYTEKIGFAPSIKEDTAYDNFKGVWTTYTWQKDNRQIELHRLHYPNGKTPVVKLFEIVSMK